MDEKVAIKLKNFFGTYNHKLYKKGEILIRADEKPSGVYYPISGRVKKYAISKKGDELIVNIFKPISFFPMSHALNQLQNNYFYEAMEDLELIKAPVEDVVVFLEKNPDVTLDLLKRVYRGNEGLLTRMTYLMAGNAYSRLIAELIIIAKRFGQRKGQEVTILTSEKDLATQVGMTRETVSREIKILKDKKLITFLKGKLIVTDINLLEEELGNF